MRERHYLRLSAASLLLESVSAVHVSQLEIASAISPSFAEKGGWRNISALLDLPASIACFALDHCRFDGDSPTLVLLPRTKNRFGVPAVERFFGDLLFASVQSNGSMSALSSDQCIGVRKHMEQYPVGVLRDSLSNSFFTCRLPANSNNYSFTFLEIAFCDFFFLFLAEQ